jgi:hypothetical protein
MKRIQLGTPANRALVESETMEVVGLRDGDAGASGMGRRGKRSTVRFVF